MTAPRPRVADRASHGRALLRGAARATDVRSGSLATTRSSWRAGRRARPEARRGSRAGDRIAIARRIEVPERDVRGDMLDVWRRPSSTRGISCRGSGARRTRVGAASRTSSGCWTSAKPARTGAMGLDGIIRMRETDRVPLRSAWIGAGAGRRPCPPAREGRGAAAGPHRGHRRPVLAARAVRRRGLLARETKNAFITISCDDELLARARSVIEREFGLHVVAPPRARERRIDLRALEAPAAPHGAPGVRGDRKRIPGGSSACRSAG